MTLRVEVLSRVKILGQALCPYGRLAHGIVMPYSEDWGVVMRWGLYVFGFLI